jgi:acylphosphatase
MELVFTQILIDGRVQAVGYRRYAQKSAQAIGISGWARNLLDGRVEILVFTDEEKLTQFLEILKKGPPFSQVRDVIAKRLANAVSIESEFKILPDEALK